MYCCLLLAHSIVTGSTHLDDELFPISQPDEYVAATGTLLQYSEKNTLEPKGPLMVMPEGYTYDTDDWESRLNLLEIFKFCVAWWCWEDGLDVPKLELSQERPSTPPIQWEQ